MHNIHFIYIVVCLQMYQQLVKGIVIAIQCRRSEEECGRAIWKIERRGLVHNAANEVQFSLSWRSINTLSICSECSAMCMDCLKSSRSVIYVYGIWRICEVKYLSCTSWKCATTIMDANYRHRVEGKLVSNILSNNVRAMAKQPLHIPPTSHHWCILGALGDANRGRLT